MVLSLVLHGVLGLWLLGSAWLLQRAQPYRLASHTVFLAGDSPVHPDRVLGEGGGAAGLKQEGKEPGAVPSVEKVALPVEKPVLPPPKPVAEKAVAPPPPRPVVEKATPPPPKPVVEKPAPPAPPKPVLEKKAVPAPPKPPPEAMTLAQKEKKTPPPPPAASTSAEVQEKLARLRERQAAQQTAEAKAATAAQQTVAQLRDQQTRQEGAEQRIRELRARVGNSGSGDGSGSGSGTAGTGSGSGLPGGGRGTGTAGAGGIGTGGLPGIRLRTYQSELQAKITNAWNIPPQSKDLRAEVLLIIDRAGNVEHSRLVQGSGNALFDESLQRAIKQAQPLPALPEDYASPSLRVTLNFRGRG
jgi:TonB family protein